jgi:ADP-ribosylglycohydrolase
MSDPRHWPIEPEGSVADELETLREQGYEIDDAARAAVEAGPDEAVHSLRRSPSWAFVEPSGLADIEAGWKPEPDPPEVRGYEDRVLAAWYGRCAGCCLGKPVEMPPWDRVLIRGYLESVGAYPLEDYIPGDGRLPEGVDRHYWWDETSRGNVDGMARDDDIDYTILNLQALEAHGADLTTEAIAEEWQYHLPFAMTYTAERIVYRQLVNGVPAVAAGGRGNPFREWIGALIRADAYGYVLPGRPYAAARLAYRDACLSHRANGIYGEMWAAALVAAAFGTGSAEEALRAALGVVPPKSRLAKTLTRVEGAFLAGGGWEETMVSLEGDWAPYGWVHTINNAGALAAALLWGAGDFSRTVGLAVEAGLDTDSIGATAGSVFGALHGTAGIPSRWVEPLRGPVRVALADESGNTIEQLAERTAVVRRALDDNR